MAIAHQFEYVKPPTLREAVRLLARYGTRARALAWEKTAVTWMLDDATPPWYRNGQTP